MSIPELLSQLAPRTQGIYILKFARPFGGTKHKIQYYGGWSKNISGRLYYHSIGSGSRVTRAALRLGISWEVVYIQEGGQHLEAEMKKAKSYRDFLKARGVAV